MLADWPRLPTERDRAAQSSVLPVVGPPPVSQTTNSRLTLASRVAGLSSVPRADPDVLAAVPSPVLALSLSHGRPVAPFFPLSLSTSLAEVALGLLALDRARTRVARAASRPRPTRAGSTRRERERLLSANANLSSVAEFISRERRHFPLSLPPLPLSPG